MTKEQNDALLAALKEVHDQVHGLYPKVEPLTGADKSLRNRLLVIDLAVHLAEEVIGGKTVDEKQVKERSANLLYAAKLVAPDSAFEKAAAELLLEDGEFTATKNR